MVLRRSTTRCTWPSDFSNSDRSTVTFIAQSVRYPTTKVARTEDFGKTEPASCPGFPWILTASVIPVPSETREPE